LPGYNPRVVGVLLLNTLCNALAFTTQFAYVAMTFDTALYGPLIACCIALQGALGLLAWPGLCPNPFGATAFEPVLLGVLLPPTVLLLACPLYQRSLERQLRHGGDGAANSATAALAKRHMWTFTHTPGPSPATDSAAAECAAERAVGDDSGAAPLLRALEWRAERASWSYPSAHDWRSGDGSYASSADSSAYSVYSTASAPSSRPSSFSSVPVPYPHAW